MKEIKELEKLLNQNCKKYDSDCTRCPYSVKCDRYEKLTNGKDKKGLGTYLKIPYTEYRTNGSTYTVPVNYALYKRKDLRQY